MEYQQKPNSGSIFNNTRKQSDNHPDRTGNGLICCPACQHTYDVWLNGWLRTTKTGEHYLSLSIRPKTQAGDGGAAPVKKQSPIRDEDVPDSCPGGDDEVPF